MEGSKNEQQREVLPPYPDNPYIKLQKVAPDDVSGQIFATLADLTNPLSVEIAVRQPFEDGRKSFIAREVSLEKRRLLKQKDPLSFSDQLSHLSQHELRQEERYDRLSKRQTERILEELKNSSTLILLRDAAQDLYKRYTDSGMKLSGTAESYYMRQSQDLWEKMHAFVQEYLEVKDGVIRFDPNLPTNEIMSYIFTEMKRIIKVKSDIKTKPTYEIPITPILPDSVLKQRWDKDDLKVEVTEDCTIRNLTIDEHFSYTQYSDSDEELFKAYSKGETLTPDQKAALKKAGFEVTLTQQEEAGIIANLDMGNKIYSTSPLLYFPNLLPADLHKKLEGKSKGNHYTTHSRFVGSVQVNIRLHDYGEYQYFTHLDTSELSFDDGYRVLRSAVESIKSAPRVSKVKETSS